MEIQGKFNVAKVFTDMVEPEAVAQIINMCCQKAFYGSKVRIMPDVHAGKGCTIGTTMTITDKVVPNLVGVDIGCGMEVCKLRDSFIDYEKLDKVIRTRVPSGFAVRKTPHNYVSNLDLTQLRCYNSIKSAEARVVLSLGTLGGGNHFIEVDKDDSGSLYIVIHSGSRYLGVTVASYYQQAAYNDLCRRFNTKARQEIVERCKAEGRAQDIERELKALHQFTVPKDFAYCEGELFDKYIHDMKIVQKYAVWNRRAILDEILDGMGLDALDGFTTIHNYIDTENMILRKGAVSAQKGERLIIPINMRDGALICVGKGNPDWNFSAPHGAGRIMSRSRAKSDISVEEFVASMDGIFSTTIGIGTIDESPMAYKPMESILTNITDTVDVESIIKPVYNFKAGEEVANNV